VRLLELRVLLVAMLVPLIARLPLARQEAILEPRRVPPHDSVRDAWIAEHVDGLLAIGRPLVRRGCLTRGLTHFYFLRRAGVDVRLVYGISTAEPRAEGHCWLVRDGEPYLEQVDPRPRFVETYSIPRAAVPVASGA
jgi:Transglutaminase-like superfamily